MTGPRVLVLDKSCLDHGYKSKSGYANVRRGGEKVKLHRCIFQAHYGYLPEVVMHLCDNPRCIEISHLAAGDWDLNNKDRARKGRSAESVPSRQRLTEDQVREIRERFPNRQRPFDPVNGVVALSREFDVNTTVIYQIASRRTYRNVA